MLCWETTDEIRRILKAEEKGMERKFGKLLTEFLREINNVVNMKVRTRLHMTVGFGKDKANPWFFGSVLAALFGVGWLPAYIYMYYSEFCEPMDSMAIGITIVAGFFVFMVLALGLQFPYIMYFKSSLALMILIHIPIDLMHLPHLQMWKALRKYFVDYRLPVNAQLAQTSVMLFLSMTFLCLTAIETYIWRDGLIAFKSMTVFALGFIGMMCLMFSLTIMGAAVEVWNMMKEQIGMLKKTRFGVMCAANTHKRLNINDGSWMTSVMKDTEINVVGKDGTKYDLGKYGSDKGKNLIKKDDKGDKKGKPLSKKEKEAAEKAEKGQKKEKKKETVGIDAILSGNKVAGDDGAGKKLTLKLTPLEILDHMIVVYEEFDMPPTVFGLRMDHQLPKLLGYYCLVCLIGVGMKFFQELQNAEVADM